MLKAKIENKNEYKKKYKKRIKNNMTVKMRESCNKLIIK
jgi:hypothetical protein